MASCVATQPAGERNAAGRRLAGLGGSELVEGARWHPAPVQAGSLVLAGARGIIAVTRGRRAAHHDATRRTPCAVTPCLPWSCSPPPLPAACQPRRNPSPNRRAPPTGLRRCPAAASPPQ